MTLAGRANAAGAANAAASVAASGIYSAEGTIEDIEAQSLTISHGPIAALKWPAMTMGFKKRQPKAFPEVKPGDRIRFEFKKAGDDFELVAVHRIGGGQ